MAGTYNAPMCRAADVPIIRGRTITTAGTARAFIAATCGEDIPITATITPTISEPDITVGPITPGQRRFTTDGDGAERRGTDTTADISRRIRYIRRRHSGSPTI